MAGEAGAAEVRSGYLAVVGCYSVVVCMYVCMYVCVYVYIGGAPSVLMSCGD